MANKSDIWTPRQIEICSFYALDRDDKVLEMLSNNIDAYAFVETYMKDKLGNDLLRERIIAKIEELEHNCSMHNYDARIVELDHPAEIKSEQHSVLDGRSYQVTGGGAFGSIEDYDNIDRLIDDNPMMCVNAFFDGRLVYNVAFLFNDSTIADRLRNTVDKRKNGAKTAPKFMWSDWKYAESLNVTYFNEKYYKKLRPYASNELLSFVKRQWESQISQAAQSVWQELTTPKIVLPEPYFPVVSKIGPTPGNANLYTQSICQFQILNRPAQPPIFPFVIS